MKKLFSLDELDTINWASLDTKTAQGTAPTINHILGAITNDRFFWTNNPAIIASDTNG